jgi:nucleoside phosphorylase
VVLTAIESEFVAMREHLTEVRERDIHGTLFDVGTYYGRHHVWTVAVGQIGAGGESAALQVERVRTAFSPTFVVFCGVAGGRKDVRRGDVVAADVVYDYESSKEDPGGIRTRFKTHYSSDNLVQRAITVARANEWQRTIRPDPRPSAEPLPAHAEPRPDPRAFVKPLAAGARLLASQQTDTADIITQRAGDALAVEMEGFGFLHGAHFNPGISAIVVRGISDLLDDKDEANDAYWQPLAARNAAAFLFAMFRDVRPN